MKIENVLGQHKKYIAIILELLEGIDEYDLREYRPELYNTLVEEQLLDEIEEED